MIASSLNQRRFDRLAYHCDSGVVLRGEPRPRTVTTEDIGLGGAQFRTEHVVDDGTPVLLYLRLRPDTAPIECKGKVCWRTRDADATWRFGVSFVDLADDERAAIEELVAGCGGDSARYH